MRHTGNMTAWDLVRQGMWYFHKVTREGHRVARDLFRQACITDPDLSEANAWLGRVSAGIIAYGWSDDVAADGREGTQAALRAVALDPRDPYAHYSFAIVNVMQAPPTPPRSRHRARSISIQASRSAILCMEWRGYSMAMRVELSHRCGTVSRSTRTIRRTSRGTSCWPTPNYSAVCWTRRSKARIGRWRCVLFSVRRSSCFAAVKWRWDKARRRDDGANV